MLPQCDAKLPIWGYMWPSEHTINLLRSYFCISPRNYTRSRDSKFSVVGKTCISSVLSLGRSHCSVDDLDGLGTDFRQGSRKVGERYLVTVDEVCRTEGFEVFRMFGGCVDNDSTETKIFQNLNGWIMSFRCMSRNVITLGRNIPY